MQRLVWTSDIHLDRMDEAERVDFKGYLQELAPGGFIIAGDIAEADSLHGFLTEFSVSLNCPIYFVLGNHDFWNSSFERVRANLREYVKNSANLRWLSECDVIALNAETALIGYEGWADGRYAPVPNSGTVPRDFMRIDDLKALPRAGYQKALNNLGDESAAAIRGNLLKALEQYKNIYLVTHVPPFAEAALDRSRRICDAGRLPFYSCKAVGDVLLEIMSANPESRLTVLCGHTHEKCEVEILPNLHVKVLDAGYGSWYQPGIIKI